MMKRNCLAIISLLVLGLVTGCARQTGTIETDTGGQVVKKNIFDRAEETVVEITREREVTVLGQDILVMPEEEIREGKLLLIEF